MPKFFKKDNNNEEEDPFERWIKRFFSEDPFKSIFEDIRRLMKEILSFSMEWPEIPPELKPVPGKPKIRTYTWGFTVWMGPDGKIHIKEFGNVKPRLRAPPKITTEEFEPLATVYEEDDIVKIVVDLPGATKESIECRCTETEVEVRAEAPELGRKYRKKITLPHPIDPDNVVEKKFVNGVLTLAFKKKSPSGKTIKL